MFVLRSLCTLAALGAALVPLAQAQVASSPNYQLSDVLLDGGGGGGASGGYGGWISVGTESAGTLSSPNYQAGIGLLETSDPIPSNDPVVFGLVPDRADWTGGTPVAVYGWNFDKFGVGPSVTMDLGGNPATGVSVSTNTLLTATVPAGDPGPTGVVVTSSLGSGSDPDGWMYTPAVVSTAYTQPGGEMDLSNYGDPTRSFITLAAGGTGFAGTQMGPFLLNQPFIFVMYGVPYGVNGEHTLHANVPNNLLLVGFTIYMQSLEATQYNPVQGRFTNATSVTFQ
jgi:hypothetical protein